MSGMLKSHSTYITIKQYIVLHVLIYEIYVIHSMYATYVFKVQTVHYKSYVFN